jgi:indole-3-glycerol phosphate synthase
LGGIVVEARQRASVLRARERELERAAGSMIRGASLAEALRGPTVGVIAEIKRRSPSKGAINLDMTAVEQARAYEGGGAAAISVLTEPAHFEGSVEDLISVRAAVAVPVLKKDFHVDPIQLLEARAIGASAALLIVRALSPDALRQMVDTARQLELEILVEVRDEAELARALEAGAAIIGINNRNLVERAARSGADAVLVGSVISAAKDPAAAVLALSGVKRVARAG